MRRLTWNDWFHTVGSEGVRVRHVDLILKRARERLVTRCIERVR
jgi:hypothetical protein